MSEEEMRLSPKCLVFGDLTLKSCYPAINHPDFKIPKQGFKYFEEPTTGILVSISHEKLWDCFSDLTWETQRLLKVKNFDVEESIDFPYLILDTSPSRTNETTQIHLGNVDLFIFMSRIEDEDYKSLFLDCGFTGIAFCWLSHKVEIQFDAHKEFIIYGCLEFLTDISQVLLDHRIQPLDEEDFHSVSCAAHTHQTDDSLRQIRERFIKEFKEDLRQE